MSTAAPLFVFAPPFCGASTLAQVLGPHPALCVLPQLHLLLADTLGGLLSVFAQTQGGASHGLLRALAQLDHGRQTDDTIAAAQAWLAAREEWPVSELLAHLAARAAPRRLVIPEADSPLRPMDLARFRSLRPKADWLHLTRHPFAQGLLLAHWAREQLFVPQDFKDHSVRPPVLDPEIAWWRATQNLLCLAAAHPPAMTLRAEALDDDANVEAQLAAVLGIDALPQQGHWPFAEAGPRRAPYGLEAEATTPVPAALLKAAACGTSDSPPPWAPQRGFSPEVRQTARSLGYR